MTTGVRRLSGLAVLVYLSVVFAAKSIPNVVLIVTDDQDVVLKGMVSTALYVLA